MSIDSMMDSMRGNTNTKIVKLLDLLWRKLDRIETHLIELTRTEEE